MSNFNNKGLRKDKIRNQVKHLNSFYEILDQLEEVYQKLILADSTIVTADNVAQLSAEAMGRELDSIELMVIRGKLGLETKLKLDESQNNK